jgi:hypothetical protein
VVQLCVERTIAAPPERVFDWLADPVNLAAAPFVLKAGYAEGSPEPGAGALREATALWRVVPRGDHRLPRAAQLLLPGNPLVPGLRPPGRQAHGGGQRNGGIGRDGLVDPDCTHRNDDDETFVRVNEVLERMPRAMSPQDLETLVDSVGSTAS